MPRARESGAREHRSHAVTQNRAAQLSWVVATQAHHRPTAQIHFFATDERHLNGGQVLPPPLGTPDFEIRHRAECVDKDDVSGIFANVQGCLQTWREPVVAVVVRVGSVGVSCASWGLARLHSQGSVVFVGDDTYQVQAVLSIASVRRHDGRRFQQSAARTKPSVLARAVAQHRRVTQTRRSVVATMDGGVAVFLHADAACRYGVVRCFVLTEVRLSIGRLALVDDVEFDVFRVITSFALAAGEGEGAVVHFAAVALPSRITGGARAGLGKWVELGFSSSVAMVFTVAIFVALVESVVRVGPVNPIVAPLRVSQGNIA